MSSKIFYGLLGIVIIGLLGFTVMNRAPEKPRSGTVHRDDGRKHVEAKVYGGEEPPTSGDHAEPLAWKIYDKETPDANTIHNMEHGGIYISYRPDLPKDQIEKIKALFYKPYSNATFSPTKAIMAPRSSNKAPIVMSSWTRSQTFESFDENKMIDYYLTNIGKSPEPGAS